MKKVNQKTVFEGYRRIDEKQFDGFSRPFEVYIEPDTVCILALTKDKQVILAKQFRVGPEKTLLELPGGGIDKGEEPIEAATRELKEETGYVGNIRFVTTSFHCGYSTRVRYNFVCTECEKVDEIKNSDAEHTELVLMPLKDFRNHLRSGELTDVATGYLGLDFLDLL